MTFNISKKKRFLFVIALGSVLLSKMALAQEKLYQNEFSMGDVKLLNGPFKHAQDLNIHVLLEYDIDRLIAPFRKEAGLPEKAKLYPNWAGLDGHVGGPLARRATAPTPGDDR